MNFNCYTSCQLSDWQTIIFAAAIIWSAVWAGLGLWKASRNGHKWWFIAFLVVHTLGILEILYIYVFSKKVKSIK